MLNVYKERKTVFWVKNAKICMKSFVTIYTIYNNILGFLKFSGKKFHRSSNSCRRNTKRVCARPNLPSRRGVKRAWKKNFFFVIVKPKPTPPKAWKCTTSWSWDSSPAPKALWRALTQSGRTRWEKNGGKLKFILFFLKSFWKSLIVFICFFW